MGRGVVTAWLLALALGGCGGDNVLSGAVFGSWGTSGCNAFTCAGTCDARGSCIPRSVNGGGTPDAGVDPCTAHAECAGCTAAGGCGFCFTGAGCRRGTSLGPDDGACPSTEWKWLIRTCSGGSDPCSVHPDCASCSGAASCGYCTDGAGCLTGTRNGPQGGECFGNAWVYLQSQCNSCSSQVSCGNCVAQGICGYCRNGAGCQAGQSGGPDNGACSFTQWSWFSSECP